MRDLLYKAKENKKKVNTHWLNFVRALKMEIDELNTGIKCPNCEKELGAKFTMGPFYKYQRDKVKTYGFGYVLYCPFCGYRNLDRKEGKVEIDNNLNILAVHLY